MAEGAETEGGQRQRGAVVWITGVPSSGKSTLAAAVAERLGAEGVARCILDSDAVREALVPSPGYSPGGRDDFYETLARLAAILAEQGLIVLVAATAHKARYRAAARQVAPRFVEVFVAADDAARRDAKGLYRALARGRIAGLPGADVPYEEPDHPDVVARGGRDAEAVNQIVRELE